MTIKIKLILIFFSSVLAITIFGLSVGYILGVRLFRENIIQGKVGEAELLKEAIERIVKEEVQDKKILFQADTIRRNIAAQNKLYEGMSTEDIQDSLFKKDSQWTNMGHNDPLKKAILNSSVSKSLESIVARDSSLMEAFVTDKYGGLVASSGKTTDYYQADEAWWQDAYNNNKGNIILSDIVYDQSSKEYGINISMPIYDTNNKIIGIGKGFLSITRFLAPLSDYESHENEHIILTNQDNYIIYHQGITPLKQKLLNNELLKSSIVKTQKWLIADENINKARGKNFLAFADVNFPFLKNNALRWRVFISVPKEVFFSNITKLIKQSILLFLMLIILNFVVILYNSGVIVRPIKNLINETRHISKNNFDHRIKIKSKDEIGELSNSINMMLDKLKEATISKNQLSYEIKERISTQKALEDANIKLKRNETMLRNLLFDIKKSHSDLKNAQSQLLQSEKLASLGQLSAGVAHEINNPLGFVSNNLAILKEYIKSYSEILGAMETLKESALKKDFDKSISIAEDITHLKEKANFSFITNDIDNLIEESKNGTERIKKIVQDLKAFSRKDEGQMELNNIEDILEGVINIVWNEIKYKSELIKDYGEIPLVKCNAQKIGQVFINILVNASQSIEEKGVIKIKTYKEDNFICIAVSDTGCGIPEDKLGKIFDPFYTTKEVGKGTGLGLSIGYDIVKQHNGEIKVESVVGKGTKFIIKIPA